MTQDFDAPQFDLLTPDEKELLEGASAEEIQAFLARPEIMARAFAAIRDYVQGDSETQ